MAVDVGVKMLFSLVTVVLCTAATRPSEGSATATAVNVSILMYDERFCSLANATVFETAAGLAVSRSHLPSSVRLNLHFVQTEDACSETGGFLDFVRLMDNPQVDVVIGAVGSSVCQVAVSLAVKRTKPFISWRCSSLSTSERLSSAFALTVPPAWHVAHALVRLIRHFGWKYCVVVTTDEADWPLLASEIDQVLRESRHIVRNFIVLRRHGSALEARDRLAAGVGPLVKVIILCMDVRSSVMHRVLQAASELRMTRGGFTFLALHVLHTFHPRAQLNIPDQRALHYLFVLTFISPNSTYSHTWDLVQLGDYEIGDHVFHQVYDSVALFANALERTAAPLNGDEPSFTLMDVMNNTKRFTYPGLLGSVHMNNRGDRQVTYVLLAYDWSLRAFQSVVRITDAPSVSGGDQGWFRHHIPPPDEQCVLNEEDCNLDSKASSSTYVTAVILSALFVTLTALIIALMLRRRIRQNEMTKGPNKIIILPEDLVFVSPRSINTSRKTTEFNNLDKPDLLKGSHDSLRGKTNSSSLSGRQMWDEATTRARYNGDLVHVKYLHVEGFEIKNRTMKDLKMLRELRHENVNSFLGFLLDSHHPAVVYEFCSRGSLADVIASEDVKLDWAFKLSLLTDLVRGMKYIHCSPVRQHGRLTSRNCIIDSRWVLKVTDYGLPAFFDAHNLPAVKRVSKDLLWTAPELLRQTNSPWLSSQLGDVYSFAIVMQEMVVRGSAFCMLSLTADEIIEKIKRPPPLIRPSVSKQAAPPEAINIMRQCWAEVPEMRPDFNSIHEHFKKLNQGKKINIVDTMFQMLEKYSNNLEELIRERTEQLAEEKKKTEQLLHRMLPSTVAEKLMLGMPIEPEAYEEVTIYFSDIVGFTTISAYSTPMEIVDLLNDLYTCFDATINGFDVYKVETIGDAYMVVGGLPLRNENHANQVAMMALDLLHQSGRFKIRHMPSTPLKLRIGVHSGPCCAGVVGLTMPRYCLFGDTVNTAARMESTGLASRIHMSEATKLKLDSVGGYHIQCRGQVELKGKGKATTYWLLGKVGFDKELPPPSEDGGSNHGLDEEIVRRGRLSSISYCQDLSVPIGMLPPALKEQVTREPCLQLPVGSANDEDACITVEIMGATCQVKMKEDDNGNNGDLNGNVSLINSV